MDPATLVDNPNNARRPHRDRDGLAPSIGALGILNPPLVRQLEDGRLELIAGERRKYSAIKAGLSTIPVFVRDDLSPVHQLASMLVENHDREGLTPSEEAVAIAQLAGFEGITQRDITTMTGIKAGVVRTALKVAASEVATAIGERHDLSLDQLMVLAEFDTDAEAVKALTVTALKDPSRFDHLVAQLRRDRDDRAAYEQVARQVTESRGTAGRVGERLVAPRRRGLAQRALRPRGLAHPYPGPASEMPGPRRRRARGRRRLRGGLPLPRSRRPRPHRPAEGPPDSRQTACLRWGAMTDEQKAERRRVVTNNKAWEVATPVRREYVTELLARRSVPKGTLRYVTEVIMADPGGVAAGNGDRVASLIGKDTTPRSLGSLRCDHTCP